MWKIVNKTTYPTRELRALITYALRSWEQDSGNVTAARFFRAHGLVNIGYGRRMSNWVGGWAILGGNAMKILLPRLAAVDHDMCPTKRSVAFVFLHELHHNIGLDHGDIHDAGLHRICASIYNESETIAPQAEKPKVRDVVAERESHARVMLERAETRLKRARTLHKKWSRKVTYYTNKRAAAPKS